MAVRSRPRDGVVCAASKRTGARTAKEVPVPAFGLFFYFFDGMNFPPVSADFGVVSGDSFHGNGPSDWRQVARKPGNALGHNAARAIHALYFGIFANADIRVAVASFCHLSDEPADGGVGRHFVGPAVGILGNQLTDG